MKKNQLTIKAFIFLRNRPNHYLIEKKLIRVCTVLNVLRAAIVVFYYETCTVSKKSTGN